MTFQHLSRSIPGLVALTCVSIISAGYMPTGYADTDKSGYTEMSPEQLAEHLIFEADGFRLDQPTQEGSTVRDRQTQDELQKICSETRNRPSAEQVKKIVSEARASIEYPQDGIKLGNWQKGGELAWSGFGYRVGHRVDDHSKREVGGNCYNCHALSPERPGGTIGPSLTGYGKQRGNTEQTQRFVYEMIYNPHTYFACSNMPRFGARGLLDEQAIADIMAYVLHPDSPVNR